MHKRIIIFLSIFNVVGMYASDTYSPQPPSNPYAHLPSAPAAQHMIESSAQAQHVPVTYEQILAQYSSKDARLSALDRDMQAEYAAACASDLPMQQSRAQQMTQAIKDLDRAEDICSSCCCCCYCSCKTYVPHFNGVSTKLISRSYYWREISPTAAVLNQFNSPALHEAKAREELYHVLSQSILSDECAKSIVAKFPSNLNLLSIQGRLPLFDIIEHSDGEYDYANGKTVVVESPYRTQVLDAAVARGINLEARYADGDNALHIASTRSLGLTKALVRHLKDKGLLVRLLEQKNNKGETPLTRFGTYQGALPAYKLASSGTRVTPMKWPSQLTIPLLLLRSGACPSVADSKGHTYVGVAEQHLLLKSALALYEKEKREQK